MFGYRFRKKDNETMAHNVEVFDIAATCVHGSKLIECLISHKYRVEKIAYRECVRGWTRGRIAFYNR